MVISATKRLVGIPKDLVDRDGTVTEAIVLHFQEHGIFHSSIE